MNKTTILFIIVAFIVIALAYITFTPSSEEVFPGGGEMVLPSCKKDVLQAQDEALGKVCTQQIQMLRCPEDETFTYDAPNGCEISFLKNHGWESAEDALIE